MRKIIFLCFCALLASCSSDEGLQDIGTNGKELANMINDYELVLKGYSIDELKKEKDELTPTTTQEQMQEHTQEQLPWREFLSMKPVGDIVNLYTIWIVKMVETHIQQEI